MNSLNYVKFSMLFFFLSYSSQQSFATTLNPSFFSTPIFLQHIITEFNVFYLEDEICDNGIDDDGDGQVDIFDEDCQCTVETNSNEFVPNGDFEARDNCCEEITNQSTNCLHDWIHLNSTPDYIHPDCSEHTLDFLENFYGIPIENGFVSNYIYHLHSTTGFVTSESVGVCLNETLVAGATYTISLDIGIVPEASFPLTEDAFFTINGIPECANLSDYETDYNFFTQEHFCDSGLPYEELISVNLFGINSGWNTVEVQFTPTTDLNAIFINGDCDHITQTGQRLKSFFDNVSIREFEPLAIDDEIMVTGQPCGSSLLFSVENLPDANYQWYKNFVPLPMATNPFIGFNPNLQEVAGTYHVFVTFSNGECQLIGPLDYETPIVSTNISAALCQNEIYEFGTQTIAFPTNTAMQTFTAANGCDSVVTLSLAYRATSNFSFTDTLVEGENYVFDTDILTMPGTYTNILENENGCDSTVILTLVVVSNVEICNNGIDDDDDGFIDFLDEDCQCDEATNFVPNGDFEGRDTCCTFIVEQSDNCLNDWIILGSSPDYIHPDCLENGTAFQEQFYGVPIEDGFLGLILSHSNGQFAAESMGLCLNEPLETGESYTLSIDIGRVFNEPNDEITEDVFFTINGITNCNNLSNYDVENNFCNSGFPYEELVSINLFTLNPGWNTFDIQFTPTTDIEAIFISGDCDLQTANQQNPYAFFDNIQIQETGEELIEDNIDITGSSCDGTLNFSVESAENAMYQWYKDSLIISEAMSNNLSFAPNQTDIEGNYSVYIIFENGQCQLIGPLTYEKPILTEDIFMTICEGESYDFNSENLTESGIYQETLTNSEACDSIVTLTLNTIPETEFSFDIDICEGESYGFGGENLTESGIYQETLSNVAGCDSIIILNLNTIATTEVSSSIIICEGESYEFGDENLTASGMYQDTSINSNNCNEFFTLFLTVNALSFTNLNTDICAGESYDFNGEILTESGIYQDTLSNSAGCDSIITLNLNTIPITEFSFDIDICAGESYNFNGENLTEVGIYQDTLSNSAGCDSIIILNLNTIPITEFSFDIDICAGESYDFNGENLTETGIYQDTLSNFLDCDSIVVLNLNFILATEFAFDVDMCAGENYDFNGENLTESGIYQDTLSNFAGCDSIIILNLMLISPTESTFEIELCADEIYTFGDTVIMNSGLYQQVFSTIDGCDSIIYLDIHFFETSVGDTLHIEQKEGTTYFFHGTTYSESGIYEETLSSSTGCDSLVYLNLNFVNSCINTLDIMLETTAPDCELASNGWIGIMIAGGEQPYQYSIDGGNSFVETPLFENISIGNYNIVVLDNNACTISEQVLIQTNGLELWLELPNDTTLMSGQPFDINVLDINFEPISYEWTSDALINCPTCANIQLTANTSGLHTLMATDENGCTTSDDIYIEITKRPEIYIPNAFSPDNDGNNDYFELGFIPKIMERIEELKIFDRWGNLVFQQQNTNQETVLKWDGKYQNKEVAAGVYLYVLTWQNLSEQKEVLTGDITLMR